MRLDGGRTYPQVVINLLHGGKTCYRASMRSISAALLCIFSAFPTLAQAYMSDLSCDDSARMTATLTETLGAERQGVGLRDPETMLEVWVTARNGEWLIVQNYANGTSCIVAMGQHWEGLVSPSAQG